MQYIFSAAVIYQLHENILQSSVQSMGIRHIKNPRLSTQVL